MSLVNQYKEIHKQGLYNDDSLQKHDVGIIYGLVIGTKSETVLDYGAGTGIQYYKRHKNRYFGIKDFNIPCYDPAVPEYDIIPNKTFDGVISTDVLEHIPENDLEEAISNIFSLAKKFVYISVFCGPADMILSNGENAHCTIKSPKWWKRKIKSLNTINLPLIITYRFKADGKKGIYK